MIDNVAERAEAKLRWLSFCTHVCYSMLAGEAAARACIAGDRQRSLAETRIAIGEAAAVIARALDIRSIAPGWSGVCTSMISAADLHISGLESMLAEIQRRARARTKPSPSEQKKLDAMAVYWLRAISGARALYAALGGDPDEFATFNDFYAIMKTGELTVLPPLTIPPMEN
jgi:hypothetical protein